MLRQGRFPRAREREGDTHAVMSPGLRRTLVCLAAGAVLTGGCGQKAEQKAPIGSPANPIKMAFVPSLDTGKITLSAERLARELEKRTGYTIEVTVPVSYAAVIEAMGAGRVDVAWFAPLSYVLANSKYGAKVLLITERDGHTDYTGIILARKDSGIRRIEDLKGRRFAFGDPLSTSGTLYPKQLLKAHGIDQDTDITPIFAGGHDKAIIALYNGQVDGCSCYSGYGSDARDRVVSTIPDIKEKTVIIGRTAKIPNDNVAVSADLPEEVAQKLKQALLDLSASAEGRQMLMEVAEIDGLREVEDSVYDSVRKMVQDVGLDLQEYLRRDEEKQKRKAAGKKG